VHEPITTAELRPTPAPDSGMGRAGPRLREIRLQQGRSLNAVAAAAGVTKGFLSLAERGLTRISVPTLLQICSVLGVGIGSLFDYPNSPVAAPVPLDMGGLDIREYLLTPASERQIQVMRTELEPGGGSGGTFALDTETIFVTVLLGIFELVIEGEIRRLTAGESTTFDGHSRHEWRNPSPQPAEVLWVLAPPLPTDRIRPRDAATASETI
jgi:transcriptional regulator with XRE-family HTH domain